MYVMSRCTHLRMLMLRCVELWLISPVTARGLVYGDGKSDPPYLLSYSIY